MSKSRVIIMRIESQKMGLNKAVDRAHRSMTRCMMDREAQRNQLRKNLHLQQPILVSLLPMSSLPKTTRIANAATCLDRVGERLEYKKPYEGYV
jgi:hypothetical protein